MPRSNAYVVAEGASTEHSSSHDRFHQLLPAVRCRSSFNESAAVTLLLKKPSLDINILKNYRLMSNLPFISKVLERVVASQLKAYMDYNNLHDPLQSAYKSAHSTTQSAE